MLPGFRFLFAAVVLSFSIMVFGLGAAALLRAAHEQVASIPARPAPPEAVFAQKPDVTNATLAMLRVDTPGPGNAVGHAPETAEESESVPAAARAVDNDTNLTPPPPSEAAKPDNPISESSVAETSPQIDSVSAQSDPASASSNTLAPGTDMKIASNEAAAANEPAGSAASSDADTSKTRTAALDDAPAAVVPPTAEKIAAKPDQSDAIKRRRAERRKQARRLRLARLAQQATAPITDAFMQQQQQPIIAPATTVRTRR